jgi:hypothetical protein
MPRVSSFVAVLLVAAALPGCAGTGGLPSAERPGTTIKITNPNAGKWTSARVKRKQASEISLFVCKPLACAGNAAVAIMSQRSPTRHPDRVALEKAAKLLPAQTRAQDVMMEAVSEGDERATPLSSKVIEARGYPAIVAETKRTTRGKVNYIMRGDLFIGMMLVKVVSQSTTREEARRNFDEFVGMLEIFDVEPQAPDAPPSVALSGDAQPGAASGLTQQQ